MSDPIKDKVKGLLEQANLWKTNNKGNRGQINQNVGTVINGISEEALSGWFAELKGQIQRNSDYMIEVVTNAIDSVLVSKVAKIVAEAYHTHCLSNTPEKEELKLTLRDIQNKAGSITTEIQAVIKKCNGTKEKVDELVRRLNSINEEIKAELRNILDLCDKILSEIRFANERIGKLTTLAKENKDAIASLKKIVLSYIQLSEKHHEESQLILTMQDKKLSSPGLDEQTIVAMRVWFDKISQDLSKNSKDQEEIIESIKNQRKNLEYKLIEVQNSITELGDLINKYGTANEEKLEEIKGKLSQKAKEILQREAEIYDLALDTNQATHKTYEKAQEILYFLQDNILEPVVDLGKTFKEILQNTNGPEKEKYKQKLNEKICELQQSAKDMELQLQIAAQEGGAVEEACPYCGYVELRGIGGGKCQCDCCGNTFTPKSKTKENDEVKMQTVEEQEKAKIWRKEHTAILENVGPVEQKHCLCRMSLKDRNVSSKGVLIIPSTDFAGRALVSSADGKIRLAFCQPNINDEVGRERMRRIKTLILPSNMILTEFNDKLPFSNGVDGLEKVLRFDEAEKECTEDIETLKLIKKRSV